MLDKLELADPALAEGLQLNPVSDLLAGLIEFSVDWRLLLDPASLASKAVFRGVGGLDMEFWLDRGLFRGVAGLERLLSAVVKGELAIWFRTALNGLFKLLAEGLELFKLLEAEANCKIDCAVS